MTILYARLNLIGFLFLLLKGIYNTQVNRQASVARILFAGFSGIFSNAISKFLLDAQISEYSKNLSAKLYTYDTPQDNKNTTPTAPSH